MRSKLLIGGLLASAISLPALAQQSPAPAATPAPGTSIETTARVPLAQTGVWRASKLMGLDIYNEANEKLGDINEILVEASGKVSGVVIGVGGFLGMGQRDIMVAIDKLKFVNEPVKTSATSTTTTTPSGASTTGSAQRTTTTTTSANDKKWYPDHAVLSGATKDQLKAMPEFKY